ncbi:MAG TPA: flagellar biosynthesis anti-sigma factor FlgM [Syntrophales bacterium]|nr:flagellar biosynthesis anti-sigma factor FlgM [Syntrophobacterales bacterium]HRR41716.1 flagellar biosynthesis anti-sigma factor FlgM [Syntrophales bacterium]HRT27505.1 flagellar biosynthesis anti-sigma factor FlgM [Syntrophales bacterium]HRT70724.1 flagellar biosynthesis anti-sigma factor FlgM [Syntrophales bacterium]
MKISKVDDAATQAIQQYQRNGKVQDASDRQVLGNAEPREKVDLSAAAKDIGQLKGVIAELPDVREDKVNDLKSRIEQGTYNVSGEKIVDKMLGESIIDIFG